MSIIASDNVLALGTVLFALAWFGFWMDTNSIGKKTSGVIWILWVAMALSNTNIIPLQAPTYDFVGGTLVPLAIPLLLFKADLRKIFRESGVVMITFCLASMATVIGAVLGFYLLELGDIGPKVAGVYSGAWIGGMVNFLAVSQAVEMTPDEFSVALSASAVVSILALMMLLAIPSVRWITNLIPSALLGDEILEGDHPLSAGESYEVRLKLAHVCGALAISFAICAVAQLIAQALKMEHYSILFITVLTILVANLFPTMMANLEGDFELGMLIMYLFFVVAGASTDATSFLGSALYLFFYGMCIIFIHLALVLTVARLFKVDLAEAIVASGAALVGPAVTAAIATSRGWKDLVTPAIMCGIFGYVIATFIGVTVTKMLT